MEVKKIARVVGYCALLAVVAMVSAEVTSRIEDLVRFGTPLSVSPDFDRDLFDDFGHGDKRGKPNGHYKHIELNQFGFRAPHMESHPAGGVCRVMLLGASETFGMYESPGKNYPDQLRDELKSKGSFEVVNTAIPGMTLQSVLKAYDERLSAFKPGVVVIYVSPLFDLNIPIREKTNPSTETESIKPKPIAPETPTKTVAAPIRSRFIHRLPDVIDKPEFIQRMLDARVIAQQRKSLTVFSEVPTEIVDRHLENLQQLVQSIEKSGSIPILVTHAIQVQFPPTDSDIRLLESAITNTPRATPAILLEYEECICQRIITLAQQKNIELVDLAGLLNGQHEAFGDLVHFTDLGAKQAALAVANGILNQSGRIERIKNP